MKKYYVSLLLFLVTLSVFSMVTSGDDSEYKAKGIEVIALKRFVNKSKFSADIYYKDEGSFSDLMVKIKINKNKPVYNQKYYGVNVCLFVESFRTRDDNETGEEKEEILLPQQVVKVILYDNIKNEQLETYTVEKCVYRGIYHPVNPIGSHPQSGALPVEGCFFRLQHLPVVGDLGDSLSVVDIE